MHDLFRFPLQQYAYLRTALYSLEGLFIPLVETIVSRERPRLLIDDPELFKASRRALLELLQQDVENIVAGVYPIEVLRPESPLRHLLRVPVLFREGLAIARRRRQRESSEFASQESELLAELPEYYRRNFHYQGGGYLTERSADLYEHQVEVLFAGAADAMRRLILRPLKDHFADSDGSGLTFLEVGAGTGRATRFVRLAFPKAKIVTVDLSGAYLKKAQRELARYPRHSFIEADAEQLPFREATFDAVYSVFLFHELPIEVRRQVLRESVRVLRPDGFLGLVDSIQLGDQDALDPALKRFPVDYHEPFFANYIQTPMETNLAEVGVSDVETDVGFFSKACWGRVNRPAAGIDSP